jgi:hypothetical protein
LVLDCFVLCFPILARIAASLRKGSLVCLFICFFLSFLFWARVSLCSPDQTSLELTILLSASWVLCHQDWLFCLFLCLDSKQPKIVSDTP